MLKVQMKPLVKQLSWMAAGMAIAVVMTVSAQQNTTATPPEPCVLNDAAKKAVNDHMAMITITSSDPDKYFNQNCLGDLAFLTLDLSILIPDPLTLLTNAAITAVQKIKQAAINKICKAARNAINDTVGRYNSAISQINGFSGNLGGALENYIDSSIAKQGQALSDKFNLDYNTPVTNLDNAIPGTTPQMNTTPPNTGSGQTTTPGSGAQQNPVANTPASNTNVGSPPAQSAPAQPATIGSSIFGR